MGTTLNKSDDVWEQLLARAITFVNKFGHER